MSCHPGFLSFLNVNHSGVAAHLTQNSRLSVVCGILINVKRFLLSAVLFLGATIAATLAPVAPVTAQAPLSLPQPVGYVNDFANVISSSDRAQIEDLARRVNAATKGDVVVVTMADLGGRPVEEVALNLGRTWKVGANAQIGDAARNAGVIILVVPKESSADGRGYCRIETGQGAEGFITDATAGTLCRSVVPQFQAGDYSAGITALSVRVADLYARSFGVTLNGLPEQQVSRNQTEGSPVATLFLIVVIFIIVTSMNRRGSGCAGCIPVSTGYPTGRYRGGGWGGGGFGGGGGGFGGFGGGGGFSGGGGGSSW